MFTPIMTTIAATMLAAPSIPSTPDLGMKGARCRANESGPAIRVNIVGLKDRRGTIKMELYPYNNRDFLQDDNILVSAGKTFKRVVSRIPRKGNVSLCIRAPKAGRYSLSLLHDRNGDRKFNLLADGVGFPGDPTLGRSKPTAAQAKIDVGSSVKNTTISMQYLRGVGFKPIKRR